MASPVMVFIVPLIMLVVVFVSLMVFDAAHMKEHERKMEEIHCRHVSDMLRFGRDTMEVTYIVPCKQTRWQKLRKRVGVYPYTSLYRGAYLSDKDKVAELETCRYYIQIPESALFYMRMKGWVETDNKELALNAMEYMNSEIKIP